MILRHRCGHACTSEGPRGFTLVEMLSVMAIVAILLALVAPAVNTMVRGPVLTETCDGVVASLAFARQKAESANQKVEVRFYQYADTSQAGESANNASTWKFRASQLFLINDSGAATAINRVEAFPAIVMADSGAALSTILSDTRLTKTFNSTTDQKTSLPGIGTNYNCQAYQFRPDGTTNLPLALSPTASSSNLWYLTLHQVKEGDGLSTPPSDYATLQIDPLNGARLVYRP